MILIIIRQIRFGLSLKALSILFFSHPLRSHGCPGLPILYNRDSGIITEGSAFIIKAMSLRFGNFSEDETRSLYLQHTEETVQMFKDETFEAIWYSTCG